MECTVAWVAIALPIYVTRGRLQRRARLVEQKRLSARQGINTKAAGVDQDDFMCIHCGSYTIVSCGDVAAIAERINHRQAL